MDSLTIDRVTRAGRTLTIDPPFVLTVRASTITGVGGTIPCWEARVDLDDAEIAAHASKTGWFAGRELTPRVVTLTREERAGRIAEQVWYWWDHVLWSDDPRRSSETQVQYDRLKKRIKETVVD